MQQGEINLIAGLLQKATTLEEFYRLRNTEPGRWLSRNGWDEWMRAKYRKIVETQTPAADTSTGVDISTIQREVEDLTVRRPSWISRITGKTRTPRQEAERFFRELLTGKGYRYPDGTQEILAWIARAPTTQERASRAQQAFKNLEAQGMLILKKPRDETLEEVLARIGPRTTPPKETAPLTEPVEPVAESSQTPETPTEAAATPAKPTEETAEPTSAAEAFLQNTGEGSAGGIQDES